MTKKFCALLFGTLLLGFGVPACDLGGDSSERDGDLDCTCGEDDGEEESENEDQAEENDEENDDEDCSCDEQDDEQDTEQDTEDTEGDDDIGDKAAN